MLGLIVLLTFLSVFILVIVIAGVITRGLQEYEERYAMKGAQNLESMFLFVTPRQLLTLSVAMGVIFLLLGIALFNAIFALFLGVLGFVIPLWIIRYLRVRRVRLFDRQLVDALVQMSSAFKAGLTFAQAADNIAREMPAPLGQEFSLFIKEIKLGVSTEEALINLAGRVGSEDLDLVVVSSNVSRKLGGNMAEMFEIIAGTIRERFRMEGKIRALTSQGRLQAIVVAIMPIALFFILNWMRPDLTQPMLHHRFGYFLIGTIVVMELVGIWLIRRIVTIDV